MAEITTTDSEDTRLTIEWSRSGYLVATGECDGRFTIKVRKDHRTNHAELYLSRREASYLLQRLVDHITLDLRRCAPGEDKS